MILLKCQNLKCQNKIFDKIVVDVIRDTPKKLSDLQCKLDTLLFESTPTKFNLVEIIHSKKVT